MSSGAPPAIPSPNPATIAHGPMLIGCIFNVLLLGIMYAQSYLYFTTYKRDQSWMKAYVASVGIVDTLQTVLILIFLYNVIINHFGDFPYLGTVDLVFALDPFLTALASFMVQMFFAWRVKVLTQSNLVVTAIIATSFAGFAGGIGTTIEIAMRPEFSAFPRLKGIALTWLIAGSVADILISVSLVYHLQNHKTGFGATDNMVNRIMRLAIQTGIITLVSAILDIVLYFVNETGGLHLIFNIPLCKLYSNALLSSLNSRGGWKSGESRGTTLAASQQSTKDGILHLPTSRPQVFVQVESHEMVDGQARSIPEKDNWSDRKRASVDNL